MKTLWEQLTEKQQTTLLQEADLYPNTWLKVLAALKSNYGSTYLLLGDAMTVWFAFNTKPFDLDQYFNIFDDE